MEAIKQDGIETITTSGQRARMSDQRMVFVGAMVLTAFYVVWGIVKMLS